MNIEQNIINFTNQERDRLRNIAESTEEQDIEAVDIYQRNQDRFSDVSSKTFPKGSSKAVDMSTYAVIDGVGTEGLAKAYNRAKKDVECLKDRGERGRAEIRRQQYMNENFLPAVEIQCGRGGM